MPVAGVQDEHGAFKFDAASDVKGPDQQGSLASSGAGPLMLITQPAQSQPLALGGPTLGLSTSSLRPLAPPDTVYQVRRGVLLRAILHFVPGSPQKAWVQGPSTELPTSPCAAQVATCFMP